MKHINILCLTFALSLVFTFSTTSALARSMDVVNNNNKNNNIMNSIFSDNVDPTMVTPILDSSLVYMSLSTLQDSPLSLCFNDESPLYSKLGIIGQEWLKDMHVWIPGSLYELFEEVAICVISVALHRAFRSKPNNNNPDPITT